MQWLLQVDLIRAPKEALTFVTPKGRVFPWKLMPFGVMNAPALFQKLMNEILYILRRRSLVQDVVPRRAKMEAHMDSKKKCFSNALRHTLVVLEMH